MKELLKRLAVAEERANKADEAYNADPENPEAEAAFDEAYEEEFKLYMEAAEEIVKMTAGKINFETAKAMIKTKRSELEALFA